MTKVKAECTWQVETGDYWPPRFALKTKDIEFNVTCNCGGIEFEVQSKYPDPSGVIMMKFNNTPYSMITCKKCGKEDMLHSGEGEPKRTLTLQSSQERWEGYEREHPTFMVCDRNFPGSFSTYACSLEQAAIAKHLKTLGYTIVYSKLPNGKFLIDVSNKTETLREEETDRVHYATCVSVMGDAKTYLEHFKGRRMPHTP